MIYIRNRLFEIVEADVKNDRTSKMYDIFMIIVIIISIAPLCTHVENDKTFLIDKITALIFIVDYILRFFTADIKLGKGKKSFVIYPFTFMAVIDLISILPSIIVIDRGFKVLKVIRLFRTLKVFRVFKTFRYSKNIIMVTNVFKKQRDSLLVVCVFAVAYILTSALIMFNVEPNTFPSLFDAIYWATISLTTVGYGDVYAVSVLGKIITMISSILGIAIVALPAGIVVAGYTEELEIMKNEIEREEVNNEE